MSSNYICKMIGLPVRGRPILLITRMLMNRNELLSVLLPSLIMQAFDLFIHFDWISFIRFFFQVKVAKTLLTLIGVYIVTWIPICVIHFVRLAKLAIISDSVDLVAAFLVSLSCVTNPWIYGFKNNHFRDQLKRMLCVKVRVMRETGRCQMNQFEMK